MTFEEWFEQDRAKLAELLRGDAEEALYLAWLAGMEYGMTEMSKFTQELWNMK